VEDLIGKKVLVNKLHYPKEDSRKYTSEKVNFNRVVRKYSKYYIVKIRNKYWNLRDWNINGKNGGYSAVLYSHVNVWNSVMKLPSKRKLKELYVELKSEYFDRAGVEIFEHYKVSFEYNGRLTRTAGRCDRFERCIEFSPSYIHRFPDDLKSLLAHEMIHFAHPNHSHKGFHKALKKLQDIGLNVHRYTLASSTPRFYINADSAEVVK